MSDEKASISFNVYSEEIEDFGTKVAEGYENIVRKAVNEVLINAFKEIHVSPSLEMFYGEIKSISKDMMIVEADEKPSVDPLSISCHVMDDDIKAKIRFSLRDTYLTYVHDALSDSEKDGKKEAEIIRDSLRFLADEIDSVLNF